MKEINLKRSLSLFIKRLFDLIGSIVLIIILSPLLIIVSILIKLEDGGPVFFIQERSGYLGKTFNLIKFRTMEVGNNVMNFKMGDRPTKIGK